MKKNILVTGGAGYIGSHTCVKLLNEGNNVIVLDNLSNSSKEAIKRVKMITAKDLALIVGDVRDKTTLDMIFGAYHIDAVIHFAGLKSVGESIDKPLHYYDVNVAGTTNLLRSMEDAGVRTLVFSSSATVYDSTYGHGIFDETCPLKPINPYGQSKLMVEQMLQDITETSEEWSFTILRYFNPVGAHISYLIGEDPQGVPNNLAPYITGVMAGRYEMVNVFGNTYNTRDGTGERDYIHVDDLARAHVMALEYLFVRNGTHVFNLGAGNGTTVLEMISAFSNVSGIDIPYKIVPPRHGDSARCLADPRKAYRELGWETFYNVKDMCRDAWGWQNKNPNGYQT